VPGSERLVTIWNGEWRMANGEWRDCHRSRDATRYDCNLYVCSRLIRSGVARKSLSAVMAKTVATQYRRPSPQLRVRV
jgi:hypothetical protein